MDNNQIAKIDPTWLKENTKLGLEKVKKTDLPTPRLVIVSGMSRNAVLKDGSRAAVGKLYYEGTQEQYDQFPCAFVSAEKTMVPSTDPNAPRGTMVEGWVLIGVREGDWKPFVFICRGSHIAHAGAFISRVITQGVPLFALKVVLETKEIHGQKGDFSIPVFRNHGIRDDIAQLNMLKALAEEYQNVSAVRDQDQEEEATPVMSEEEKKKIADFSAQPASSDDIPF